MSELLEESAGNRQRRTEAGLAHAGRFGWLDTARRMLDIYRRVPRDFRQGALPRR